MLNDVATYCDNYVKTVHKHLIINDFKKIFITWAYYGNVQFPSGEETNNQDVGGEGAFANHVNEMLNGVWGHHIDDDYVDRSSMNDDISNFYGYMEDVNQEIYLSYKFIKFGVIVHFFCSALTMSLMTKKTQ